MPETLELWTFCALAQPWLWRRWRQNVVPIPRQRHRSDFVPRGRPALQWLQHQLFLSSSFSHAPPPPPFLVTTNRETKNSRNVRNCGIHFSEIVSLFCKIASYIIYPSKTCYLFNITWRGLDWWEIARLDPHSNCRGFDESICRLVSGGCVTGANCVCIGFIISNITCCWPAAYSTALMCNIKQLAADWKEYKKLPEGQSGKLPTAGSV